MRHFFKRYVLPLSLFLVLAMVCPAFAGQAASPDDQLQPNQPIFVKDRLSLQVMGGVLFAPSGIGPKTVTFNTVGLNVRLGWMLNTPSRTDSLLTGNWEAILEMSGAHVVKGFGNYLIGPTLLLRYNFVRPGCKWIPYVQGGSGFVITDAYKDHNQDAIGEAFEFTPQASVGLRYLLRRNLSLDVEGMFHHISNASLAKRNAGINALGGFVGVTYFFNRLWK